MFARSLLNHIYVLYTYRKYKKINKAFYNVVYNPSGGAAAAAAAGNKTQPAVK